MVYPPAGDPNVLSVTPDTVTEAIDLRAAVTSSRAQPDLRGLDDLRDDDPAQTEMSLLIPDIGDFEAVLRLVHGPLDVVVRVLELVIVSGVLGLGNDHDESMWYNPNSPPYAGSGRQRDLPTGVFADAAH